MQVFHLSCINSICNLKITSFSINYLSGTVKNQILQLNFCSLNINKVRFFDPYVSNLAVVVLDDYDVVPTDGHTPVFQQGNVF